MRTSVACRSTPLILALSALGLLLPASAGAQSVRGWVGTNVQVVELRPIGLDTVPFDSTLEDEDGGFSFQGRPVKCVPGVICTGYNTRAKDQAWAATEDLALTAWGFGMEGLSFTTLIRGRTRLGAELVWPRSDDRVDVMLGFAQWVTGATRIRLGRQELRTGLGFPAFDGGAVNFVLGDLDLEGYGGRSLARGLREPAKDALRGIEAFLPDESAYLLGAALHTRFFGTALTARYHREILADRSSLVSERGSVDVSSVFPGVRVSASFDYDFGLAAWGKSHLTASFPLVGGRWLLEATARRYVPYFELSTIWGFFQPVAYSELEMRTAWAGGENVSFFGSVGWRKYGDADATVVLRPLQDTGWRGKLGLRWTMRPNWVLQTEYGLDWMPGAFLSALDTSVRWVRSESLTLSAHLMTFQQIEEFRLGEGRALGGGFNFDLVLTDRIQWSGGTSILKYRDGGSVIDSPWNQARGWTSLRVAVGNDPGLGARFRR
jgi:hypothetical protein